MAVRIRHIKPEFFKHEGLAEIDPLARLLFEGLWCMPVRSSWRVSGPCPPETSHEVRERD